jgi:prolyl oligopeptidase
MQAAQGDSNRPILLRVEASAGHGAGKPLAKIVEESADFMAFLMRELGMRDT